MPPSPAAIATARRNVVQRIERFLADLERDGRQADARETFHVRVAMERLKVEHYPEAEEAMLRAERDYPAPAHHVTAEPATIGQLRAELEQVLRGVV